MLRTNELDRHLRLTALAEAYAGGNLELWTAPEPDDVVTTPQGVQLRNILLGSPAFALPVNSELRNVEPWRSDAGLAAGTPGFFRLIGPGGAVRQGSAGMKGSGAQLEVTDQDDPEATSIITISRIEITSFVISYLAPGTYVQLDEPTEPGPWFWYKPLGSDVYELYYNDGGP